jgi:DMSO/TMAO reductase YedYZ molybdopterin-dependent catalytic subunit
VLLVGALIGLLAARRFEAGAAAVIGLVAVGTLAALRDPTASPALVVLSAALQVGVGLLVLSTLLTAAGLRSGAPAHGSAAPAGVGPSNAASAADPSRRGFIVRAGIIGGLALVAGGLGRAMLEGRSVSTAHAAAVIPPPVDPAPSLSPDDSFPIDGLTPLVVPNDDFYRIDTALVTPSVDLASWRLRVHGMVDHEVTLTFDELVQLPLIERYVTIACVSNEVGGNLVGNAKWTGVNLTDVLAMAGVKAGATQIVPRSVDGWTAGFPTSWVMAPERPRDAIIAVKMNGQPLPAAHGFPARLIVPGLYGYVSATKWLSELELTTLEAIDAYWVPRGWAKEAPILTQSRIDVPRQDAHFRQGDPVAVAGVAWAPDRGVSKVEVRVDDGDWRPATLATAIGPQTWLQWKLAWTATPGRHTFTVRATDGTGVTQEEKATPPPPDGARGYDAVSIQVD